MSINVQVSPIPNINILVGNSGNLLNLSPQGYTLHANTHISGGIDAVNHNYLLGLQGGQNNEYYHLNSGEYFNLVTGEVIRPIQTGQFYANSNPSGFITGINNIVYDFGDQNISGIKNFYLRPTVNGTGILLIGEVSGGSGGSGVSEAYVTGISGALQTQITYLNSQTGDYTLHSETGAFYPSSNPSGFITGINLSSYATIEYVTGVSGLLQNEINTLYNQTGDYVLKSNTGQFLTTGAADNRYVDLNNNQTIYGNKTFSNDVYINHLFVTGTETIANTTVSNIQSPYILLNLTGGAFDGGIFFVTGSGLTGINDSGAIIGFDHSDKFKFGISTRASDLSTLDTIASFEDVTTISGGLQSQISTLNNQTGGYVLKIETGQFYASSNPSGFITGINNLVYTTGDQSISGNIDISGNLTISGVYNIYQQIENAKILAIAYAIAL